MLDIKCTGGTSTGGWRHFVQGSTQLILALLAVLSLLQVFYGVSHQQKILGLHHDTMPEGPIQRMDEQVVLDTPPFTVASTEITQYKQSKAKSPPGWTRLANMPKIQLEASCVIHRLELWCIGGLDNDGTVSYSPLTNEWTRRPNLLDKTHHSFQAAISVRNGTGILQIGGLSSKNFGEFKTQYLDTSNDDERTWVWQSGDNVTNAHEQDIGGASACTTLPVDGLYYCIFSSDLHFVNDTVRYFSFHPDTLQFTPLPIPEEEPSHMLLIADQLRGRVIMTGHRTRAPTTTSIGSPSPRIHFYNVKTQTWTESQDTLPEFMVLVDARGFWQNQDHGFFMGGQNNFGDCLTDIIYKFTLSPDPHIRSIHFERWSRTPSHGLFGLSVNSDPLGSDQLMVVGGGSAVGPHYSLKSWYWDKSKLEDLVAYELQPRTHDDARPTPSLHIVSATYAGLWDVTDRVQDLVDNGWSAFEMSTLPNLGLDENDQWMENTWPFIVRKVSDENKQFVTGSARHSLTIALQEPDGNFRLVFCPPFSGCRLSWWNIAEELTHANYMYNSTSRPMGIRLSHLVLQ